MMRMAVTDEDLAMAAAGGDGAAFGALLDRQYDRLFALCYRLTGSRAEAQDLTQDICAALPSKLAGYRGAARVTTWLYRVAVNAAHDRRRRFAAHARAADGWGDWELARQDEIVAERGLPQKWRHQPVGLARHAVQLRADQHEMQRLAAHAADRRGRRREGLDAGDSG